MKRTIIKIDETKCDGCGLCANGCPEGALKIVEGKARLVGELYCDGLGACIGTCPQGAISVQQREAVAYDERKTMENIVKQGPAVIKAHLQHLRQHDQNDYLGIALEVIKEKNIYLPDDGQKLPCGCPSTAQKVFKRSQQEQDQTGQIQPEIINWPVQLRLINPNAGFFDNADLLIASDCVPFAYPDFHRKLLKGKVLLILCPKLDQGSDGYIEKLTEIFKNKTINTITVARMEVPCCFGSVKLVEEAIIKSAKNIKIKEVVIGVDGTLR